MTVVSGLYPHHLNKHVHSHTHTHTHTHTHSQMLTPNLSPLSNEHTLIHLKLTNLTAICSTNSQLSSALSTTAASFPHMSSSVHHSEGTKPPPCIMYALIDLIETENVMFHSGALLIGWLSVTRLVRQLQTGAVSLDES